VVQSIVHGLRRRSLIDTLAKVAGAKRDLRNF
jgi:hypothetical protein